MDNIFENKVYIFDLNGKSLKTIGQKGGGPEEYALLDGMTIDRKNKQLIVYDNMKRRFMYYTLNGEFLYYVIELIYQIIILVISLRYRVLNLLRSLGKSVQPIRI